MPTQFNGLCLEKAEIAELNTLEVNYGKLKDKTKEATLDKERRNKLSQKKKWGVVPPIILPPRSDGKPHEYPTIIDLMESKDPDVMASVPTCIMEKYDDGILYAAEKTAWDLKQKKSKKK